MSATAKFIIVLPCEGSPYIWKNELFTKKGISNEIRKVVNGGVQQIHPSTLRIHPIFENRWRIVSDLLYADSVEIYVNENGYNKCTPNMACIRMDNYLKVSRVPYFGEIALVVSSKTLQRFVTDIQSLFLVRVCDYYAEMGFIDEKDYDVPTVEGYERFLEGYIFEPEDDIQSKQFDTFALRKNWSLDTFGHVYMKKTGRSDEKQHFYALVDGDPFESSDEEDSDEEEEEKAPVEAPAPVEKPEEEKKDE